MNYQPNIDGWITFEENSLTIALNTYYTKEKDILYFKNKFSNIILLMIPK